MPDADHQTTLGGAPDGARPTPTHTVVIPPDVQMVTLLGPRDELLRTMERAFPQLQIHVRGNEFHLSGPSADVALAERTIDELLLVIEGGQPLNRDAVERSISMLRAQTSERPADVLTMNIVSNRGRTIRPKTLNQKHYVDAIDEHTIVFGIGPAGTGTTYLAMAKAVQALQAKQVNRIILTRPAVEAGERLGFLPGTLFEKIDPYLRPLYDALHDMVDPESIPRLIESGTVEVAPLAYMRGRAQPVDTLVPTPTGFRRIGSLRVGDYVVGSDGRPTVVLGVYPQGRKPVFRVGTQDGAGTLACAEHLWFVTTRDDRRRGRAGRVVTTEEMRGRLRRRHAHRYELPLTGPVEFAPRDVPLDPYALGLLLSEARVTAREPVLVGARRPADPERAVPTDYLVNSAAVRLGVLQGMLDTDGVPSGPAVRYTTCSPRLRDDTVFLVRSLGGIASWTARAAGFDVDIRLPAGVAPFRLARKQAAYDATGGGRPMRFVHSIEPAGEAECVCIAVGAADSLYVTSEFLVTHNTLNDAFIVLDEAQNTSPEQMKMFLTRLGFGSKIVVTGDVTQIDLPTGTKSGLKVVREILDGIEDVHFTQLGSGDVVRHKLVSEIVDAYARYDAEETAARSGPRPAPRRARRD